MNYYLVIFSNRTETLDFSNALKYYKIDNGIIATPKGIGTSCGISVKIYEGYFEKALRVLRQKNYLTFTAIYKAVYDKRGGYKFSKI